jgi:class 3 adenylate cyclase
MVSKMKSDFMEAPEMRDRPIARLTAAFMSLPLRFKITIPYLVVAILLAGLATWVITQSFVNKLQERFDVQLVDDFETASTQVFQAESKALITERAIARTIGVAEAVAGSDTSNLNILIRPLVINAHAPVVHVLDASGGLLYGLRLTSAGSIRDEAIDFSAWTPVRRVLANESDNLGDKFSGIMMGPAGPTLYVVGPLLLNDQRVGVVLVGYPLDALLPQMKADSVTQVTLYQQNGLAAFSMFSGALQMPALSPEMQAIVNAQGTHPLQNRIWELGSNQYSEAVGPLLVRGQPSGWAIAVALPRSLITRSARISPSQLLVAFATAIFAVIGLGVVIAKIISLPVFELVDASTRVANGDLNAKVREQTQDEVGLLSRQFNYMVSQLRQREFMRDLFGRMVSEEVREAQLRGDQVQLGGEIKIVSVLFTDIRQFTRFSERHSPQEVMRMLNIYFSIVNGAVREAGGMINKFGGDSAMAVFGAPLSLDPSETAHRALRAALSIRFQITESNARCIQEGLEPINIGIGINTGEVMTGNVGAENRFEYTVIGDTVNVAARMQSISSQYKDSNILISRQTYEAFAEHERLQVVDQGAVMVKGRTEPVHVYNVLGMRQAKTSQHVQTGNLVPSNEVPGRDALEAVYLYCRGFDPTTIATTKNMSPGIIQLWIKEAAAQFELVKQELGREFNLTEMELQRLHDANRSALLPSQNMAGNALSL